MLVRSRVKSVINLQFLVNNNNLLSSPCHHRKEFKNTSLEKVNWLEAALRRECKPHLLIGMEEMQILKI